MILLISSILLTAMYFMSGLNKIQSFNDTSNGLSKKPLFKNFREL